MGAPGPMTDTWSCWARQEGAEQGTRPCGAWPELQQGREEAACQEGSRAVPPPALSSEQLRPQGSLWDALQAERQEPCLLMGRGY